MIEAHIPTAFISTSSTVQQFSKYSPHGNYIPYCHICQYSNMGYLKYIRVIYMRTEILKYQRIRDLREDNNLSQKDIAEYLNIKQNTYSRYETNDRNIPLEIISQLADYYYTSVDYIINRTNVKTPYPKD